MQIIIFIFLVFITGYSYAPTMPEKMHRELSDMVKEECRKIPRTLRCENTRDINKVFGHP